MQTNAHAFLEHELLCGRFDVNRMTQAPNIMAQINLVKLSFNIFAENFMLLKLTHTIAVIKNRAIYSVY